LAVAVADLPVILPAAAITPQGQSGHTGKIMWRSSKGFAGPVAWHLPSKAPRRILGLADPVSRGAGDPANAPSGRSSRHNLE
jgi:hypothetical protein